ncbi:MAG TPA: hypothetical protein VF511_07905, partial [Chthoniobacterales bacterium]
MSKRVISFVAALLLFTVSGRARVVRVEIGARSDVLDGKPFGEAGAYEKISGKIYFAVRPDDPHNRAVVDLDKAPRNAAGEVEFASDFYLLRPKQAERNSGTALIEIPNRGGKGMLRVIQNAKNSLDPATEEELGDGFLMRRGTTLVWLGWQWDVRDEKGLMRLYAPVAIGPAPANVSPKNASNQPQPITGLVRADFVVTEKVEQHPLGHLISGSIGGTEYYCWKTDDPANVLTVRDGPMEKRRVIPRREWDFVGSTAAKAEPGP